MTNTPPGNTPTQQPRTAVQWIGQYAARRAVPLSAFLVLVTLLAWGARWHWALDLASHFPVQIAAASLIPLVILLAFCRWKAALLPAAVLALNVAQILPLYFPVRQPVCSGPVICAISANVLRSNQQYGTFIDYIRSRRPDFFLAMEVDETWLAELAPLHEAYPFRVAQPGRGAFGIALYSRVPIGNHEIVESAIAGVPMIRATLIFGDRHLTVIGVHPVPPVRSGTAELRNGQFVEIAALAAPLPNPRLLLGDLNATSWSPHFRDLVRDSRLRDARQGFGVQPTWPRFSGIARLLQIPIDHTLVSDDVEVVARRVGPDIGSDHRPVEIELRIGE